MSTNAIRTLSDVPALRDRWVAIDPRGRTADDPPSPISLKDGAVVVDADEELDVLCARVKASRRTSLTIVFAGRR